VSDGTNTAASGLLTVEGNLAVEWSSERDEHDHFAPTRVDATGLEIFARNGPPAFERIFSERSPRRPDPYAGIRPLLLYDLDRDGFVAFTSYMDPHLKKTLDVYAGQVDFLKNFKADDRKMTRFIIGTIAKLDKPRTPRAKGSEAIAHHLQNITNEDRQRERTEILKTTPEDIQLMAKMVEDILKKSLVCVYGNEKKLKDNQQLFQELIKVIR